MSHGQVQILLGSRLTWSAFGQHRPHGLEEGDIIADLSSLLIGHGQGERLGQVANGLEEAILAVRLCQDMLLSRRQEPQPLDRGARHPLGPVEAVHQPGAHLVLLFH